MPQLPSNIEEVVQVATMVEQWEHLENHSDDLQVCTYDFINEFMKIVSFSLA